MISDDLDGNCGRGTCGCSCCDLCGDGGDCGTSGVWVEIGGKNRITGSLANYGLGVEGEATVIVLVDGCECDNLLKARHTKDSIQSPDQCNQKDKQ